MRTSTASILVLFAAGLVFLLGRYLGPTILPHAGTRDRAQDMSTFPRCLVLVVDQGEVYCGKDRAPRDGIGDYVRRTMQLNRADVVIIRGSDMTRYGDIAELAGKLHQRGVKTISIATTAVPTGVRLPVIDTQTLMRVDNN